MQNNAQLLHWHKTGMKTLAHALAAWLRRHKLLPARRTTWMADHIKQFNAPRCYYASQHEL